MTYLFLNKFGRIRSGWRFVFFLILFFAISLIAAAIINRLSSLFPNFIPANTLYSRIAGTALGLTLVILLGWLCGKYFEGLPFRALGVYFTKFWAKDLVVGVLFGCVSVSFAVLIAAAFGNYEFSFNGKESLYPIAMSLALAFVIFVFGAAFEEVLVRGYIFQTFTRANLAWLAIILTSLFFAAGHLQNPASNTFSTINTALAGIWLGLAYLKTRTLWFVFGLHFAWNWVQGALFGIEVSGLTTLVASPLLVEIDGGPKWITGGDYGLEGGAACTLALIISTAVIWFSPVLQASDEMIDLTSRENPNENYLS